MSRKRCRVLYTQAWSGGGSELSLYELVRGLDQERYEPIVMFRWPGRYRDLFAATGAKVITLSEMIPTELLPPEVPPEKGDTARNTPKGLHLLLSLYRFVVREPRQALRVARIIKAQNADIVHHNCGLNADRTMVLAGLLARVPQVSHFRLFGNLTRVARRLVPYIDAFIYNSKAVCECYTRLGIPAEKGHVIYNPIDSAAFLGATKTAQLRKELGLGSEDCVVSNVGRIVAWKGQACFLRAMAEVVKVIPNTRVLIVGEPGPAQREQRYERELRNLTRDLGLSDQVIFTGLRSDIPAVMAISDVVVHSATKPEPFGRVIAEAVMAGRPVVATDGGGVPEIVDDGATGLLVPPDDEYSMAQAIGRLLSNRAQAQAMGQRARQAALERFTVQHHVQAVEGVYREIMNQQTPKKTLTARQTDRPGL